MSAAHGRDRLGPERHRCDGPRCAGRRRAAATSPCRNARPSHCAAIVASSPICATCSAGIGIVELQRVHPSGEIGIAPIGQDPRAVIGLDPIVVPRRRGQRLLAALDIEIGMRLDPGMIERGVVGHEIEHEPQAARGEPGAERGQRGLPAQRLIDLVGADGKARAADVVFRQIRQRGPELGLPCGVPRDTARLAAPVCHTLKSQIQSKPRRARSSKVASSTSARVTRLPACFDRRDSQTRVLIS